MILIKNLWFASIFVENLWFASVFIKSYDLQRFHHQFMICIDWRQKLRICIELRQTAATQRPHRAAIFFGIVRFWLKVVSICIDLHQLRVRHLWDRFTIDYLVRLSFGKAGALACCQCSWWLLRATRLCQHAKCKGAKCQQCKTCKMQICTMETYDNLSPLRGADIKMQKYIQLRTCKQS